MCGDAQCPSCGKAQGTYEESISAIVNELVSDWMDKQNIVCPKCGNHWSSIDWDDSYTTIFGGWLGFIFTCNTPKCDQDEWTKWLKIDLTLWDDVELLSRE